MGIQWFKGREPESPKKGKSPILPGSDRKGTERYLARRKGIVCFLIVVAFGRQGIVEEHDQFQNTAEVFFSVFFDPGDHALPTCVLAEKEPDGKGCGVPFFCGDRGVRGILLLRQGLEFSQGREGLGEVFFIKRIADPKQKDKKRLVNQR